MGKKRIDPPVDANHIQGEPVDDTTPGNDEVLVFNSTTRKWEPSTPPISPPEEHGNEAHDPDFKPDFSENTAFNKDFGSGSGDVCEGDDARLSDARTPTEHGNEAHDPDFAPEDEVNDVSCRAYNNSSPNQEIPDSTSTPIDLGAEDFDTDSMHDNVTNNTRITIPAGEGGKYLIVASCNFWGNASGIRGVSIRKNGSTFLRTKFGNPVGTVESVVEVLDVQLLAPGDYIEMLGYQSTGANLKINTGSTRTFLAVIKQREG